MVFTNWWSRRHIWWNVLDKSFVTGGLELFPWLCRPSQDLSILRYMVVRSDGKTQQPQLYCGPDAAKHFLAALQVEEHKINAVFVNLDPMHMTPEDHKSHMNATDCHVCNKALKGDSVRDHCHITGEYRGAAHNACKLKLRLSRKTTTIPVVFHNLRGYDSHLIMQAISETPGKITCIPNNTKKYISFSLGQLRFIDSAQFMLSSLDKLVKACDQGDMRITAEFKSNPGGSALLLCRVIHTHEYRGDWSAFFRSQTPSETQAATELYADDALLHSWNKA